MKSRVQRLLAGTVSLAGIFLMLFLAACPTTVNTPGTETTYNVSKGLHDNGDFDISPESAKEGDIITLTPNPDTGYDFDRFEPDDPDIIISPGSGGVWTFEMPASDVTVDAYFTLIEPDVEYDIIKGLHADGDFTIDPVSLKAKAGDTVTLTPSADSGYEFISFNINPNRTVTSGSGGTYTFQMPASDVTVDAYFFQIGLSGLNKITPENGDFAILPPSPSQGDWVSLNPLPNAGYELVEWIIIPEGAITPEFNPNNSRYEFEMPGTAFYLGALFGIKNYTITKLNVINGTITVSHTAAPLGTEITLTAEANAGYELGAWAIIPTDVEVIPAGAGTWTFDMPNEDVTIGASFLKPDADVAQGRGDFAVASSINTWGNAPVAAYAFDGVTGRAGVSHWQAMGSDGTAAWLGVDLGAVYDLKTVRIYWHQGDTAFVWDGMTAGIIQVEAVEGVRPSLFEEGKYDDTDWKEAGAFANYARGETGRNNGTPNGWVYTLPLYDNIRGRYIRVKMDEPLANTQTGQTDAAESAGTGSGAWTVWPRISAFQVYRVVVAPLAEEPSPRKVVKTEFDITVGTSAYGTASVNPTTNITVGTQITLTATPGTGYIFTSWHITPISVSPVEDPPGTWTFNMPRGDLNVDPVFVTTLNLAGGRGNFAVAGWNSDFNASANEKNPFDGMYYSGGAATSIWQAMGNQDDCPPENWLGVDLGAVYDLGSVRVNWHIGNDSAWDGMTFADIQVEDTEGVKPDTFVSKEFSDDGWKVVGELRNKTKAETLDPTADNGWENVIVLDAGTKGRYIRIKVVDDPDTWTYWPRISSFEVYESATPPVR